MKDQQLKKVWRIPAFLGAVTLFRLLSALLGAGFWYFLSWFALIIPLFVIVFKVWRAKFP